MSITGTGSSNVQGIPIGSQISLSPFKEERIIMYDALLSITEQFKRFFTEQCSDRYQIQNAHSLKEIQEIKEKAIFLTLSLQEVSQLWAHLYLETSPPFSISDYYYQLRKIRSLAAFTLINLEKNLLDQKEFYSLLEIEKENFKALVAAEYDLAEKGFPDQDISLAKKIIKYGNPNRIIDAYRISLRESDTQKTEEKLLNYALIAAKNGDVKTTVLFLRELKIDIFRPSKENLDIWIEFFRKLCSFNKKETSCPIITTYLTKLAKKLARNTYLHPVNDILVVLVKKKFYFAAYKCAQEASKTWDLVGNPIPAKDFLKQTANRLKLSESDRCHLLCDR